MPNAAASPTGDREGADECQGLLGCGRRYVDGLVQRGGEVRGVHGQLERPGRQVVAEPHAAGDRGHRLGAVPGVHEPPYPGGDLGHRSRRVGAQRGPGVASALRDPGTARGRPCRAEVVGGGRDLDDLCRAAEVGLDGQQGAAGVADQGAHVPLAQAGLLPPVTDVPAVATNQSAASANARRESCQAKSTEFYRPPGQPRSNRSRFMTLAQAATKSRTNFSCASSLA